MKKYSPTLFAILAVSYFVFALTACGFEKVDTGYRGVERNMGKVVGEPLGEGLHFYNPFTSDITEMYVRELNYAGTTEAFTKDNQAVTLHFELSWSLNPTKVGVLLSEVGDEDNIATIRTRPNFLGALKDAIGKVDAETLIQNRDKVTRIAYEATMKAFDGKGVIAHTLNLSNISLNQDYQNAVEAKMIEKQKAEKAVYETTRIKEVAKQTVETAKADAEAIRIKAQAIAQNKGLIELEYAKRWNGVLPMYMMGNSTPFINLNHQK